MARGTPGLPEESGAPADSAEPPAGVPAPRWLWALLVAIPATAAVLGTRYGWGTLVLWTLAGVAVAQPLASAGILLHVLPRRRRFLLPGLVLLGGVSAALALAWRDRLHGSAFFLVMLAQMYVALPAFLGGLLVADLGRRRGEPERTAPWAAGLLCVALAAGCLLLALPVGEALRRWEIRRAKAWIEVLAAEVRRETAAAGSPPGGIEDLQSRVGERPPLLARPYQPSYGVRDGVVTIGFTLPLLFGIEGWDYRFPPGAWERWVD